MCIRDRFATESTVPEAAVRAAVGVDEVVVDDHRLSFTVKGSFEPLHKALEGTIVTNLVSHEPSLEEIFLTFYREDVTPELATT